MYEFGDLAVAADLDLPELGPSPAVQADWRVRAGAVDAGEGAPCLSWRSPDGRAWPTVTQGRSGFLVDYAAAARFLVDPPRRAIVWAADTGTSASTVRHLLLDQVLPMAIAAAGRLVLHASAALLPSGAVAFVGASGRGKSTLAAALARASGAALLTDDCLIVDGDCVRGAYAGARLWPDTAAVLLDGAPGTAVADYTSKRRYLRETLPWAAGPHLLRRVFLLERSTAAAHAVVEDPRPADALVALVSHRYRLDPRDRARNAADFEALTALVARGGLRRLVVPEGLGRLGEALEAVLADASASTASLPS